MPILPFLRRQSKTWNNFSQATCLAEHIDTKMAFYRQTNVGKINCVSYKDLEICLIVNELAY